MSEINSGGLAFYDLLMAGKRKWWIGVLCVGVCVSITSWIAFTAEPVYRAEAVVTLSQGADQSQSSIPEQLGGLAALAGLSLRGSADRKAEALATLESRMLTESFVRERKLLPVLFASRWDLSRNNWNVNEKAPTLWDANKLISNKVRKVVEDRNTGLITIAVEWKDPKLAAEWTSELIERTNVLLQQAAYQRANKNIVYLKKQLQGTDIIEVRQALYSLMESELKTSMLAQRADDYVFRVLDPPVVPEEMVWPRRVLLLALGLAVGVFLWFVTLVFIEMAANLREEHARARGFLS